MTIAQVNILNAGLMLVSAAIAFVAPFPLFLAAYAVLGPLHYLTQISWLHSRGYFTTGPRDFLPLVALCAVLLVLKYVLLDRFQMNVVPLAAAVVVVTLCASVAMALTARTSIKAGAAAAGVLLAALVANAEAPQALLLTLLPTVVHVYAFTALFILFGALRGRSSSGLVSLLVFVACSASFFVGMPAADAATPVGYVREAFDLFAPVNATVGEWIGFAGLADGDAVYTSPRGVALMRFLAFAYTYHYLNWFSKTSVIQWHRVPRAWSVANVVLWVGAVGLYAWDFRVGVLVLFSLSWLHVVLELPLDVRTAAGIFRELAALAGGGRARES
jgi:hypothetical protein